MKKSSEHAQIIEEALRMYKAECPDLEFPIAPDFISKPPRVDPALMFKRCEEMLPLRTADPDFEQKRLQGKCGIEFVL